jgi:hypothetical protein
MKNIRLLLSIMLVVISLVTIFGVGVQAAGPSNMSYSSAAVQDLYQKMVQAKDQNIDSFLAKLSPEDQKLAKIILTPAYIEVQNDNPDIALTVYQTNLKTQITLYDAFHLPLCAYLQRTIWYWDGTYITQTPMVSYAGYTYMIGWSYVGVTSHSEDGGQGYTYFDAESSGNFTLTVAGIVIQNWYPWIEQIVHGDGTYTVTSGD